MFSVEATNDRARVWIVLASFLASVICCHGRRLEFNALNKAMAGFRKVHEGTAPAVSFMGPCRAASRANGELEALWTMELSASSRNTR